LPHVHIHACLVFCNIIYLFIHLFRCLRLFFLLSVLQCFALTAGQSGKRDFKTYTSIAATRTALYEFIVELNRIESVTS